MRLWLIGAGLNGTMGVVMGALAAHGLEATGIESATELVETGAAYQLWHAAALAGLGAWARKNSGRLLSLSGWLLGPGALLFSGGLYANALPGWEMLAPVSPVGGVALIIGWALVIGAGLVGRGGTR